ncbi:MAG: 1-acyl-sn-glycerol-3-phosphate acyltransferase [Bacteroidales bacterium]|nr:1-acyl-sn-glycerol-3-phosphate acyltransferase [Bacteroidales bacterium]
MKRIWIAIVKLCGWRLLLPAKGERPELQRCVFVVAPHTAVSDFLIGAAYLWQLDVNGHIFIKKEFFRWPLGGLLRSLGAIPIDRGNRHNDMVGAAVREFAKGGKLSLVITPEATRKPVKRWKRGFWEIAHQAGVPIIPAYIDFGKKEVGLFDAVYPTDDYEADVRRIRSLYHKEMAKRPNQFIEIN